MEKARSQLDQIDKDLLRLFSSRLELSEEIGRIKRANGLPIEDAEREAEVVRTRLEQLPDDMRESGERLVRLLIDESKRVQRRGLNLYLIGMPDCGKTRTARKLKELLSLPVSDTDKLIMANVGKTIDEIFASAGEEGFRMIEAAVLRSAAKKGGTIVALGGGTPLWGDNARIMKTSGVTVFLDRAPERLLGQDTRNRPLIRGLTPEETDEKILRLYHERHDRYLACADFTVDPDDPAAPGAIAEFYKKTIE